MVVAAIAVVITNTKTKSISIKRNTFLFIICANHKHTLCLHSYSLVRHQLKFYQSLSTYPLVSDYALVMTITIGDLRFKDNNSGRDDKGGN